MNTAAFRKNHPTKWLTVTAMLMAMNVALSSFGVPVPGGHLYLNDIVIDTAAILLDPLAYLVIGLGLIAIGGIGAFIGDALFYPAPMFVSLVTHGLQAVVISLLANRKGGKHSVNALIGVVLGALIMVIGYTLGRAFIYSTPEYAILKLPFQFLQAGVGAVAAMIICFPAHLLRFWEKFTK